MKKGLCATIPNFIYVHSPYYVRILLLRVVTAAAFFVFFTAAAGTGIVAAYFGVLFYSGRF